MKKTLLFSCLSICVIAILFGVTIIMAKNNQNTNFDDTNTKLVNLSDVQFEDLDNEQEDLYEIVEFVPPKKTTYYMSEVNTDVGNNSYLNENQDGDISVQTTQTIDFDGSGMSITVKNKQTGEVKKYEYNQYYFNLEGEDIKCGENNNFSILFNHDSDTELTPGEYTAYVNLYTDDGKSIMQPMTFWLVEDE